MELMDERLVEHVKSSIVLPVLMGNYTEASQSITGAADGIYANIPDNRRASFGRVHAIKVLVLYLHRELAQGGADMLGSAVGLYEAGSGEKERGCALGLLSLHGLGDHEAVITYFERAASSTEWELRELAQMFHRKIIGTHRRRAHEHLSAMAGSPDPNLRRFASETLRPVCENRWLYGEPEYSLSILRKLFREKHRYPRSSVGNNLSDLARRLPETVYSLVEELVKSGDGNSRWIAERACRNLVKKEPIRVMDLLGTDEYRYKKVRYGREDCID